MKLQQPWSLPASLPDVGIASTDWRLPATRLRNLVLRGTDLATDKAIAALMPTLFKPIHLWCGGMPLSLPSKRRGTLILRNLAAMGDDQQKQLRRWLDDTDGRIHIVSTTPVPLHSLVERGLLLECLYNRLNLIQVNVQMANEPQNPTTSREGPLLSTLGSSDAR
jgi:hypothetical protein